MLRTFLSVVAAALLISVILLTPASSADTGEATILSGTHKVWTIEMDKPFVLSYAIEAEQADMNVMVIPADNYTEYLGGKAYTYLPEASALGVTNATADVDLGPGIYYLVVEPTGAAAENITTIGYQVDTKSVGAEGGSLSLVLGIGAVTILGLVLIAFLDVQGQKRP